MKQIKFTVKAKAEFADDFRRAFKKMNASATEDYVDEELTVIRFSVVCDSRQIEVLEREVPIHAYAGVAYMSPPPM